MELDDIKTWFDDPNDKNYTFEIIPDEKEFKMLLTDVYWDASLTETQMKELIARFMLNGIEFSLNPY